MDDLMPFFSKNDLQISKAELRSMIKEWDSRGLDSLSFSDFCSMCRNALSFKTKVAELQRREATEQAQREECRQKRHVLKLAEARTARLNAARKRSAIKLQSWVRGLKARRRTAEMRERAAKRKIQAFGLT